MRIVFPPSRDKLPRYSNVCERIKWEPRVKCVSSYYVFENVSWWRWIGCDTSRGNLVSAGVALKRPVVTKTSLRDQKDFEFYGIRRNTQRERERERQRKLGRKTHLGVESCTVLPKWDYSISVYFNRLGEENCIGELHKLRNGTA